MLPGESLPSRIVIIGGPGAGKTWLADALAARLQLPVYRVDDAVRDENKQIRPATVIDATVLSWVAQDRWIIDGGNSRTYAERASRADLIIRLRPPIWRRVCRVLRRDGFNVSLLRWTIGYDRVFGPKEDAALGANAGVRVVEIRSSHELGAFLSMFP